MTTQKITDSFPAMTERHILELLPDGTSRIHLSRPMPEDSPEGQRIRRAYEAFQQQVGRPGDTPPLLEARQPGRWYCSVGEGGVFEIGGRA